MLGLLRSNGRASPICSRSPCSVTSDSWPSSPVRVSLCSVVSPFEVHRHVAPRAPRVMGRTARSARPRLRVRREWRADEGVISKPTGRVRAAMGRELREPMHDGLSNIADTLCPGPVRCKWPHQTATLPGVARRGWMWNASPIRGHRPLPGPKMSPLSARSAQTINSDQPRHSH